MNSEERFSRMSLLLGEHVTGNLTNKKVLVVGVGGVGGYAAENIARAGIGNMYLLDGDKVHLLGRYLLWS